MKKLIAAILALCLIGAAFTGCGASDAPESTPQATPPVETTSPVGTTTPVLDESRIPMGNLEFKVLPGMSLNKRETNYAIIDLIPGQAMVTVSAYDISDLDAETLAAAVEMYKLQFSDLGKVHYGEMDVPTPMLNYDVIFDYYAAEIGDTLQYYMIGSFTDTHYAYVLKYGCVDGDVDLTTCGSEFGRFIVGASSNGAKPRFNVEYTDQSGITARAVLIQNASTGERNAAQKALSYLEVSAFSYKGLIEQLLYEGFTDAEAAYGANVCGADWYAQAAIKAAAYLDISSFSRSSLIDQLEYEGFTHEQAVYGVEQNGY